VQNHYKNKQLGRHFHRSSDKQTHMTVT